MIVTKKGRLGCFNEITRYLDKYLILDREWSRTYIYESPIGDTWILRVPGSTIGRFKIKNSRIESIDLYEDSCFNQMKIYDKTVLKNLQQFIGRKILFEKGSTSK